MDVQESELQELYTWVDAIPLSRPKRNIARDFSDGVLLAEVRRSGRAGRHAGGRQMGWWAQGWVPADRGAQARSSCSAATLPQSAASLILYKRPYVSHQLFLHSPTLREQED